MNRTHLNQNYQGNLSRSLVDEFSAHIADILKEEKVSSADILRYRLSIESAMCVWIEKIGEGIPCTLEIKKRLGRIVVTVSCEGAYCDPREKQDDEFSSFAVSSIMQNMGLATGFRYSNGKNCLSFMPKKDENKSRIRNILIGLVAGLALSVLILNLFPSRVSAISEQFVTPVFTAMMNLLITIAGPMVFLSIISGICGIGDVVTFGRIGKKLIIRFIFMTTLAGAIGMALTLPFVGTISPAGEGGALSFSGILGFITQIIPEDIVSPFISGNMMQIIFIAVCCGIGMLILGNNIRETSELVNQLLSLVQLLMGALEKTLPVLIFISVADFVFSGYWRNMAQFLTPFIVSVGATVILALVINAVRIKKCLRMSPAFVTKKMMPTFVLGLMTASSSAALSFDIETCEKRLGISPDLAVFGIPLGQVVYMPMGTVEYVTFSMIMASAFGVAITPMWLIALLFISVVLSVATPPIPGGALSVITIMFLQLGIPQEAVGIAIGIDLILDYLLTAGNLLLLQQEMTLLAHSLEMLDENILKTP